MPYVTSVPRVVREAQRGRLDTGAYTSNHMFFFSPKLGQQIACRGTLAFDFLVSAEANPQVVAITNKARPIQWWNGERFEAYRPRFSITIRGGAPGAGRIIDVEVMTSHQYADKRWKMNRIEVDARASNRLLQVFTEKDIRVEPRLTNCRLIVTQGGDRQVPDADKNLIRQVAYGSQTFSLNELVVIGVLPYPRAYRAALNLVAAGELNIQLDRSIDGDSRIGRGNVQ